MQFFETIGRTPGSASSVNRRGWRRSFFDNGNKLLLGFFAFPCRFRHVISSYEHIALSSNSVRSGAHRARYNYAGLAQAPSGGTLLAIEISGGVVERFMAPVLKTGKAQAFVGSNPTPSAV